MLSLNPYLPLIGKNLSRSLRNCELNWMELEVRLVGGIENCFVSLPLPLIQTLDSTRSGLGPLPQVLALELRSLNDHQLWRVAWSGATSTSSAIEVLLPISSPAPPCLCPTAFLSVESYSIVVYIMCSFNSLHF